MGQVQRSDHPREAIVRHLCHLRRACFGLGDIRGHNHERRVLIREVHFANENTTLVIVATNVAQTKAGATKVAQMAHDGLARVIRPLHLPHDGDTVFALSSGERPGDAGMVGAVAAAVVADAVIAGIFAATSLAGVPAARDLGFSET